MVGWRHQLDGHEFEQAPGDSEGQGSLVGYSPWGRKELDVTQPLNKMTNYSAACMREVAVVSDSVTPGTAARQAPPSVGFSRQEHCRGVPLPSPTACARHALSGGVASTLGWCEQRCWGCGVHSHSPAQLPALWQLRLTPWGTQHHLHSCWHFMKVPVSTPLSMLLLCFSRFVSLLPLGLKVCGKWR